MLTGTLSDVGIDELATLLQQQERSGTLKLEWGAGSIQIIFRDGKITQVDDSRRDLNMLTGELLVASHVISRADLGRALEAQRSDRRPLGAILIGLGALQPGQLFSALDLQFRESLYPLYSLSDGTFSFDSSGSATRNCAPPPLDVEELLLEAVRRIDELPEVRNWIPDRTVDFARAASLESIPPGGPMADRIRERGHIVYTALSEPASTARLVGRTGLSSFDVLKGLSLLYQAGHIVPADASHSAGTLPSTSHSEKRRSAVIHQFRRGIVAGGIGALLAATLLTVLVRASSPERPASAPQALALDVSPRRDFQTAVHLTSLTSAIELFNLEYGSYPDRLEQIVTAGMFSESELTFPDYDLPYYYRRVVDGYVIFPPLK